MESGRRHREKNKSHSHLSSVGGSSFTASDNGRQNSSRADVPVKQSITIRSQRTRLHSPVVKPLVFSKFHDQGRKKKPAALTEDFVIFLILPRKIPV